jgi:hypothetical protein
MILHLFQKVGASVLVIWLLGLMFLMAAILNGG